MNALSSLWGKFSRSKEYRESFAASVAKRMIPLQIRVLRKQRGSEWSQARLAKESKLTQGVISRAEDPDYGNMTVNTLVRIAGGFDCAFIGRFIPFSELGKWYANLSDEKALEVLSFEADTIAERKGPESEKLAAKVRATGRITDKWTQSGTLGTQASGDFKVRNTGKIVVQIDSQRSTRMHLLTSNTSLQRVGT